MANNGGLNLPIRINDKEVKRSFNEINKEYYKLIASVKKLDEGTEEYIEASKRLANVEKERKEMIARQKAYREELAKGTETLEEQTSAMQEFGDNFADAFSALQAGDMLAFRTAMLGVTTSIQTATRAGLAFIATPIGIALSALAGIAVATQQWFAYNKEAAEANRTTQAITRLSGEALDQARVRAVAIEKTFGTDFKESLEVASGLVNAFGISYKEAFDRIENGLIRGGKQSSEFLNSLKEYPKLFSQAGFTVEDFQRIVNTGIDMKIYSDKLPDAIKEFSLSVMEATPAAREALENAFEREFTDKLFNGIKDGSITVKDALGLVAGETERIGLNSQQAQQLTADLFRGAGEDAGGALLIFEAFNRAIVEQERVLTPLEAEIKRVADATKELETAQNAALKSDKYSAWVNDLEVSWIKFKTGWFELIDGIIGGIASVDEALNRFRYQLRGFVRDAFSGKDADWEKLGKEADAIQAAKEKLAAAQNKAELDKQKKEETPSVQNGFGLKEQQEAEKKAAEAAKLKEARNKEALAAEKKKLEEINNLEEEYKRRSEDREDDSASKKAIREQERALEKAKALGAEKALLDQIEAEHQIKIDEAKKAEEEKEIERLRNFESKKLELENELELLRAETDAEKEEVKREQELEKEQALYEKKLAKFEEEMAFLKMTDEEKNRVIEDLKKAHELTVLGIQKKATDEKIRDARRLNDEKKKLLNESLDAAINAAGQETKIGQALLIAKQFLAIKETAINLGLFQNKMALNLGEATGAAATGAAETAKVGFPQNIPLLIGFGVQIAGIISAVKSAAKSKEKVNTSFAKGGYTDLFGLGYTDETGHEPAGIVHKNEYVVPEFLRKDPEVPQILNYLETKRKKKLGLYASGGEVDEENPVSKNQSSGGGEDSKVISLLQLILEAFEISGDTYFGFEAEQKRQEAEKKLKKIQENAKIKKK